MRVPSSLQAAVELSGASVDLSPEVLLQEAQRSAAGGQTTVTGEPIVPPCSPAPSPLRPPPLHSGPNVLTHTEHCVLTHVHTGASSRLHECRVCGGSAGASSGGPRLRHAEDTELVREPEAGRRLSCD